MGMAEDQEMTNDREGMWGKTILKARKYSHWKAFVPVPCGILIILQVMYGMSTIQLERKDISIYSSVLCRFLL